MKYVFSIIVALVMIAIILSARPSKFVPVISIRSFVSMHINGDNAPALSTMRFEGCDITSVESELRKLGCTVIEKDEAFETNDTNAIQVSIGSETSGDTVNIEGDFPFELMLIDAKGNVRIKKNPETNIDDASLQNMAKALYKTIQK